jgi:hypothetical protein
MKNHTGKERKMDSNTEGNTLEGQGIAQDPNVFNFVDGDVHTTVRLGGDALTITKVKKDEKKKTETQVGHPVSITLSAIESIKKTKVFNPVMLTSALALGALVGFIIFGGFITLLICAVLGVVCGFAFPVHKIIIKRKDGTKFPIKFGEDTGYERFVNAVYK